MDQIENDKVGNLFSSKSVTNSIVNDKSGFTEFIALIISLLVISSCVTSFSLSSNSYVSLYLILFSSVTYLSPKNSFLWRLLPSSTYRALSISLIFEFSEISLNSSFHCCMTNLAIAMVSLAPNKNKILKTLKKFSQFFSLHSWVYSFQKSLLVLGIKNTMNIPEN